MAYYGIANFANDFNKVRDDALDSGFKAKNRMRADYLADYAMPGALATIDNKTEQALQDALVRHYGFDDFVEKGLADAGLEYAKANDKLATYLETADDLHNTAVNQARKDRLGSGINLQKVEAEDYIKQLRQQALASGLTNSLDIERWIYQNANPERLRTNPYLSDMLYQGRTSAELSNIKAQGALGMTDGTSANFLNPNAPQVQYRDHNYVITNPDGTTSEFPVLGTGSNAIYSAIYGMDPSGLDAAQQARFKAENERLTNQQKAQAWAQARGKDGDNNGQPSTQNTSSVVFSGGNAPYLPPQGTNPTPVAPPTVEPKVTPAPAPQAPYLPPEEVKTVPNVQPTNDAQINSSINERHQDLVDNLSANEFKLAEIKANYEEKNNRINQSQQKIAENDRLIGELSKTLDKLLPEDRNIAEQRIRDLQLANNRYMASINAEKQSMMSTNYPRLIGTLERLIDEKKQKLASFRQTYGIADNQVAGR